MATSEASEDLADMSAEELLAYAEDRHAVRSSADRDILKAAYQWAVRHSPDALPPTDKRGRDRARPAGALGTPRITEYAAAAFGARIQTSPFGAKRLIADAVDLVHRLPRLQAGVNEGTVRAGHARHVASATRDLTADEAAWVDGEVTEVADGRLGWSRFELLVEGKVAAASPELARAKEEAAALERGIRLSRVNRHGMGTMTVRAHMATLLGIEAGISAVAASKHLEDQMPDAGLNDRRIGALALLTNPDAHPDLRAAVVKPKVKINLHLTHDSPIARMEGHGPVTTAWVRHLVQHVASGVRVVPVIDLAGLAPVDAYEIPARLREAVHLIHPADVFPFAANTTRAVDLDHAIPYADGGPTAVGNLAPLTRTHHRIKTHAAWEARQPFPGLVLWRDPYGAHYLVDATGTRRVTATPGDRSAPPVDIHTMKLVLDGFAA